MGHTNTVYFSSATWVDCDILKLRTGDWSRRPSRKAGWHIPKEYRLLSMEKEFEERARNYFRKLRFRIEKDFVDYLILFLESVIASSGRSGLKVHREYDISVVRSKTLFTGIADVVITSDPQYECVELVVEVKRKHSNEDGLTQLLSTMGALHPPRSKKTIYGILAHGYSYQYIKLGADKKPLTTGFPHTISNGLAIIPQLYCNLLYVLDQIPSN
jgi:hypothetical protein